MKLGISDKVQAWAAAHGGMSAVLNRVDDVAHAIGEHPSAVRAVAEQKLQVSAQAGEAIRQSHAQRPVDGRPTQLGAGGSCATHGPAFARFSPPKPSRADSIAAYRRSNYSEDDVTKVLERYIKKGGTRDDARAFLGETLLIGEEHELAERGITQHPFDDHEMLAAFERSPYDDRHAAKALEVFDFLSTMEEARSYIGLKEINHYTQMLTENGILPGDPAKDGAARS